MSGVVIIIIYFKVDLKNLFCFFNRYGKGGFMAFWMLNWVGMVSVYVFSII